MSIIRNYEQQVYAGVLGKVIGVYLGRPFEGWRKEQLEQRFGRVDRYVHEDLGKPLVVTDDDITGTFTFIRALEDSGLYADTPQEFYGRMWLDYLIENKTVLWWGGMGLSTEHTAYLRLKHGIEAPASGSEKMNGKAVAEQIGAQIFIDAFGLVAPGQPKLAASMAQRSARVSHDGEAVHAAVVVAGMTAAAFVEKDMTKLLDIAVGLIPQNSLIAKVHADVRAWARKDRDWRKTFTRIDAKYGYHKYGGNCHVIPNHALMVLAWAYAPDDFYESQVIVNTAGWDTDCNAANVGSVMGVKVGLDRICEKYDFRSPFADQVLLPTAEGTRSVSDCLIEALHIARIGRKIMGWPERKPDKNGAWQHFSQPGALHGWMCDDGEFTSRGKVSLSNIAVGKSRALRVEFECGPGSPGRLVTPILPPRGAESNYQFIGTPRLASGQRVTVSGKIDSLPEKSRARLFVQILDETGSFGERIYGKATVLPEKSKLVVLDFLIPDTQEKAIGSLGIEFDSEKLSRGVLLIDAVDYTGTPSLYWEVGPPPVVKNGVRNLKECPGWIFDGDVSRGSFSDDAEEVRHVGKNEGRGVFVTGNTDWKDYAFSARFKVHMADKAGLLIRYQGLQRYLALEKTRDSLRLVLRHYGETVLDEIRCDWQADSLHDLKLICKGKTVTAFCDGKKILQGKDETLGRGGAGFFFENGYVGFREVRIGKA
jgi:ADP-ribosylglycohydrolase